MATAWLHQTHFFLQHLWKHKGGKASIYTATYCLREEDEGRLARERVSHQAQDVVAREGVGIEVQCQSAATNEEGTPLLRSGSHSGA